jgi:hypothetical protein
MNALYYATRFVASGGKLPERDIAHEADMRQRYREQPTDATVNGDEVLESEHVVGYVPTPVDDYEF